MDEYWIQRDGIRIAVGDMDENHVRMVLRMILRKQRSKIETMEEKIGIAGFDGGEFYK